MIDESIFAGYTFKNVSPNAGNKGFYKPILFPVVKKPNILSPALDGMVMSVSSLNLYAPCCHVRDDNGNIKTIWLGGTERICESEQSIQYGMRDYYKKFGIIDDIIVNLGVRTKDHERLLNEAADYAGLTPEQRTDFVDHIKFIFAKDTFAFTSQQRLNILADLYRKAGDINIIVDVSGKDEKKKVLIKQEVLDFLDRVSPLPLDIALTGSMAAMDPRMNVNASLRIATGYSINKAYIHHDMFTCRDDLPKDGSQGSGHIGFKQESSYVLYKHMQFDFGQHRRNRKGCSLAEDTERFLVAACNSYPVGKQNKALSNTAWDYAQISVHNRGQSMQAVFDRAVQPGPQGGFLAPGIAELERQLDDIRAFKDGGLQEYLTVTVGKGDGRCSLKEAVEKVCGFIHGLEQKEAEAAQSSENSTTEEEKGA